MPLAARLLATDWGSPHGVTTQDHYARELWKISYYFAIPIGLLVFVLVLWCVFRYRARPGRESRPAQFQYHIPIEAAYTIIPLVIVAIIFGFMYGAENKVDKVSKNPDLKIEVYGFQWGWRFDYPNGHSQIGTVSTALDINSNEHLPVLVMPANRTVQLHVVSLDVVHTFYVPEFLFNRDLIPGINNTFDLNVTKPGVYPGQCNNICGQYHAYMRFLVDVKSPADYDAWYASQPPCSITTAGVPGQVIGNCQKPQIPGGPSG
jgi:cytochrome c oxidase subunit 2